MTHVLHLTLGPVQGFIGQARRTRDYWAGSFLLGWLAGQAMRAVEEGWQRDRGGYGKVDFPSLADNQFYEALCGRKPDTDLYIASLPNRFRAQITRAEDLARDDPCARAVRAAWKRIADAVWTKFLARIPEQNMQSTREIWDRQVGRFDDEGRVLNNCPGFFEIAWVLGESADAKVDGAWLDRRKNWRSLVRAAEPGDHCRMMGDYQELSGWIRGRGPHERLRQDAFWNAVRNQVAGPIRRNDRDQELLELGPSERLCAIALVKRLFPLLPKVTLKDILGWVPDGPIAGATPSTDEPGRIRYWPSTAHIAVAPWMRQAWKDDPGRCKAYHAQVKSIAPAEAAAERFSRVADLEQAREFGALDGGLFLVDKLKTDIANAGKDAAAARQQRPLATDPGDHQRLEDKIKRSEKEARRKQEILEHFRAFQQAVLDARRVAHPGVPTHRQRRFDDPSPFYALLLMDGDRAGVLIRDLGGDKVSAALDQFTNQVTGKPDKPGIVAEKNGVLIYAGGDDVKALLPIDTALSCALELHRAYLAAFESIDQRATISAGLVIAAHDVPLGAVVRRAHELLEDVAKDANGRNSMAIAVVKAGGEAFSYATSFAPSVVGVIETRPLEKIMPLAKAYAGDVLRSTSLLHNVEERLGPILAPATRQPLVSAESEQLEGLLRAEWLKGKDPRRMKEGEWLRVKQQIDDLLAVCRTSHGTTGKVSFQIAGGRLAAFLAVNGIGWDEPARPSDEDQAA